MITKMMAWKPPVGVPVWIPTEWITQPPTLPGVIMPKIDFMTLVPMELRVNESLEIKGRTEANVTVKVYVNGEFKVEVKADSDGNFSVSVKIEVEGDYKIEVSTVDLAGTESGKMVYGVCRATARVAAGATDGATP